MYPVLVDHEQFNTLYEKKKDDDRIARGMGIGEMPVRSRAGLRVFWRPFPGRQLDNITVSENTDFPSNAQHHHVPLGIACSIPTVPYPPVQIERFDENPMSKVVVEVSGLQAKNLRATDLTGRVEAFLLFDGSFFEEGSKTEVAPKSPDPSWRKAVKLHTFLEEATWLRDAHIKIVVMNKKGFMSAEDEVIGVVVLSLRDALNRVGERVSFKHPIYYNGQSYGRLSGRVMVRPGIKGTTKKIRFSSDPVIPIQKEPAASGESDAQESSGDNIGDLISFGLDMLGFSSPEKQKKKNTGWKPAQKRRSVPPASVTVKEEDTTPIVVNFGDSDTLPTQADYSVLPFTTSTSTTPSTFASTAISPTVAVTNPIQQQAPPTFTETPQPSIDDMLS
eukprot:TRINITY_DN2403_c0_g1_i1.p1 TRINITY_DN2403_c0_g1~~TRINITY_DN2403_c0_g1_i1.p1  ORF type:complete len:390 (-),score=84.54 TRINITY_DN2403_c0_g1_i1:219-1388(-)